MAKTRSQKKMENIQKIASNIKLKKKPKSELSIKVERLSLEQMAKMCHQSDKRQRKNEPVAKPYNLRPKKQEEEKFNSKTINKNDMKNNNKNVKQLAAIHDLPSIQSIFNRCKRENVGRVNIGQLVLAKMKSYSPWPARVMGITSKRANVFFFGTNQHGDVNVSDCVAAEFCGELVLRLLNSSNRKYVRAVREMEIFNGIASKSIIE